MTEVIGQPYTIGYRGWLGIAAVYSPGAWAIRIRRYDIAECSNGWDVTDGWNKHGNIARKEVIALLKMEMALVAWTADCGYGEAKWIHNQGKSFPPPAFLDAGQAALYREWVALQLLYGNARNAGKTDSEACQLARAAYPAVPISADGLWQG